MCLQTNDPTIHIAEEDMIVYKHAYRKGGSFFSTFMHSLISINEMMESTDKDTLLPFLPLSNDYAHSVIYGFHSFLKLEDIKSHLRLFINVHDSCHGDKDDIRIIFKCIIPKGSSYVLGEFSKFPAIVSDRIIYKEAVESFPTVFKSSSIHTI